MLSRILLYSVWLSILFYSGEIAQPNLVSARYKLQSMVFWGKKRICSLISDSAVNFVLNMPNLA